MALSESLVNVSILQHDDITVICIDTNDINRVFQKIYIGLDTTP